jgi:hypothetical protein
MKKKTRTLNVKISPDEIKKISAGIDIQIVVTHANIKFVAKNGPEKIFVAYS